MGVYVELDGGELATGYSIKGGAANFTFSTDRWLSKHPRIDSNWPAVYYPLGTTLTQANSFWARFKVITPTNFSAANANTYALFGLLDSTQTTSIINNFCMICRATDGAVPTQETYVAVWVSDGSAYTNYPTIYTLSASTTYYFDIWYDSATRQIDMCIRDSMKNILFNATAVTVTAGETFSLDSIGLYGYAEGGSVNRAFTYNWSTLYIKCNSGTTEDFADVTTESDMATGKVEIKQPGATTWTDISSFISAIKVERQRNASDLATITLMNMKNHSLPIFTPNADIRIKYGFGSVGDAYLFCGYIPTDPEYTNKVSIRGKNRTFTDTLAISKYGVHQKVIDPASSEYEDTNDKDKESSEQEDMFRALKECQLHRDPYYGFSQTETELTVQAVGYISKLQEEMIYFDEINNMDDIDAFVACNLIVNGLTGTPLAFAGFGSTPTRYLGDTKTDWVTRLEFIREKVIGRLKKDSTLPIKPQEYFFIQTNNPLPYFVVKKDIDLDGSAPVITKSIPESEILSFSPGKQKFSIDVEPSKNLWLEVGDVVYLNTGEYGLRGHHSIAQIVDFIGENNISRTLYLDKPSKTR